MAELEDELPALPLEGEGIVRSAGRSIPVPPASGTGGHHEVDLRALRAGLARAGAKRGHAAAQKASQGRAQFQGEVLTQIQDIREQVA